MRDGLILPRSANKRYLQIRQDWLDACEQDHCAAALLRQFEYWTHKTSNWSIEISIAQLSKALLGLYAEDGVRAAINHLIGLGFLVSDHHENGHPGRYRLQPKTLAAALKDEPIELSDLPENREVPPEKSVTPSRKTGRSNTLHTAPARDIESSAISKEELPLPPLSEVSTEKLRTLLGRWAGECGVQLGRFLIRDACDREKRMDEDEVPDYRERLRMTFAEFREDPSGLGLEDRLRRVGSSRRAATYGGAGRNGYAQTARPEPEISPPELKLRPYLEEHGFSFTGCEPIKSWIADIVLNFKNEAPQHFLEKVLPVALKTSEGIGSTAIQSCYSIISGYDKATRDWLREVK